MRHRIVPTKAERRQVAAKLRSERCAAKKAKKAELQARYAEPDHYDAIAGTPLLELPPELRNRIWTYATQTSEEPINIYHAKPPPLLRACRQLRDEAGSIFWSQKFAFVVGCNAEQRGRYMSADWLRDHPTPGEITQHEYARMRQAGTLGLSSTLMRRLRNPFLGATLANFVLEACDEWLVEDRRAAAKQNGRIYGWTLRIQASVNANGEWDVDSAKPTLVQYNWQHIGSDFRWDELSNAISADVRAKVKEIEAEGSAARGMNIDQIARVASALRFDIMLVRDVDGNVVMEETADNAF